MKHISVKLDRSSATFEQRLLYKSLAATSMILVLNNILFSSGKTIYSTDHYEASFYKDKTFFMRIIC